MEENPLICQFDQTTHVTRTDLHAHLRKFHIKQETYYHEYHPRRDKLTGELIPYKDYSQYYSTEFVSKVNLKKWLKDNPADGLVWSIDYLNRRKDSKNLIYAPSQVELRTLMCPSMPYYNKMASDMGGYYGICTSLGYTSRYNDSPLVFTALTNVSVIEDTREQSPIQLPVPTRRLALKVGDYALDGPNDVGIRIERKSLSDFCGTLSGRQTTRVGKSKVTTDSSFARFTREMDRAKDANLYVVMIVESDINEAQSFNYLPHMRNIKASPTYVMYQLREVLTQYPLHLQALFVAGRVEMSRVIMKTFQLGNQVRTTDLQFGLESGIL